MGVRRAMSLSGDAKQATSEGKGGPVETGLTGPAATALMYTTTQTVSRTIDQWINLQVKSETN